MDKKLMNKYIKYLNNEIQHENDIDELDTLELKRDCLTDMLDGRNVYNTLESLALGCPDEQVVGKYECLGACDGFSTYCCKECWKRILSI